MAEDAHQSRGAGELDKNETDVYVKPGETSHNKEVVWERWQKKRAFARAASLP